MVVSVAGDQADDCADTEPCVCSDTRSQQDFAVEDLKGCSAQVAEFDHQTGNRTPVDLHASHEFVLVCAPQGARVVAGQPESTGGEDPLSVHDMAQQLIDAPLSIGVGKPVSAGFGLAEIARPTRQGQPSPSMGFAPVD